MFFNKKDIVKSRIITLVGEPWFWKSFLAMFFAFRYNEKYKRLSWKNKYMTHPRIYWNLDINFKWKSIIKKISYDNLSKIEFSETPWLLLFDETFQNAWSRDSLTKENKNVVNELWALWRKKNLYVVFMAQSNRMIDVLIRELSFITIELHEPFHDYAMYNDYRLIFHGEIYKRWVLQTYLEFNLFELLNMNYSFDSIQVSKMRKKEKKAYTLEVKKHKQKKEELDLF